jgi:hypothetical protein
MVGRLPAPFGVGPEPADRAQLRGSLVDGRPGGGQSLDQTRGRRVAPTLAFVGGVVDRPQRVDYRLGSSRDPKVEAHLARPFERLGISARTELATRALREGWLEVPSRS